MAVLNGELSPDGSVTIHRETLEQCLGRKALLYDKKGEELDDYNKGLRSGYLLCQSDHAGSYIYDKVLGETKDKDKAAAASQSIGQHRKNGGNQ
jgi:hypothetical protein